MRATIACTTLALSGCLAASQSAVAQSQPTSEQRALVALLKFRGDVARGETAVDRCTTALRGGNAAVQFAATVSGARLVGSVPAAATCPALPGGLGSQRVLAIDSVQSIRERDSVVGRESISVMIMTTTHAGHWRYHERYVLAPAATNLPEADWLVLEYQLVGSGVGDRIRHPPRG